MLEFFATLPWGAVLQIIVIDILLGGDNAVVIALAVRNLPDQQRTRGVLLGTLGAIVLRVVLIAFAVVLLDIPFLKFVGGLLLLWIGVKLMMPDHSDPNVKPADQLWAAIKTIIVADAVMSLDNVIAVAAAANGSVPLLVIGLAISVPLIVAGAALIMALLTRLPLLVWAGAALLGWIAGDVMATDPAIRPKLEEWFAGPFGAELDVMLASVGVAPLFANHGNGGELVCAVLGVIVVLVVGTIWRKRALQKHAVHSAAA